MIAGVPGLPSPGPAAAAQRRAAEEDVLIGQLRESLAAGDPSTDRARAGFVLLGNAEASRGNLAAAADAWRKALRVRFDPVLAAQAAEAAVQAIAARYA